MFEEVMAYVTPANVQLGVSGLLVLAGIGHALPGSINKAQQKMFGFPGWFIICAGLLMLGTGIGNFFLPSLGVYFVSMVIGGTITTAIVMPSKPIEKPGGILFSAGTLAAAVWAYPASKLGAVDIAVCVVTFLCGVAGVKFLPKNVKVNKMVNDLTTKKEKKEEKKPAPAAAKAKAGEATKTAAGKKSSGRTESPAPTARTPTEEE